MSQRSDSSANIDPGRNRLLAALPPESYEAIRSKLEVVEYGLKVYAYHSHQPIEHVYFPCTGVFSLLSMGEEEDQMIEVATVGNEGFVGLPVFLGADSTPGVAFSQIPGWGWRTEAAAFRRMIAEDPAFTAILNRYTLALFTQIAQATFCNRVHPMVQRCARWILMTHDRAGSDEYPLTHEFLSQMLGVRRASVSEAVGALQAQGLIGYSRGTMRVLDRDGLEQATCICYAIIRDEHQRLTGPEADLNAPRTTRESSPIR